MARDTGVDALFVEAPESIAELEQIVVAAMIDSYGQGRLLDQKDLEKSRDQTVPLGCQWVKNGGTAGSGCRSSAVHMVANGIPSSSATVPPGNEA